MITAVLSGILALIGLLLFKKGQSASALLENLGVKSDLNVKDKDIAKNDGLLEAEESKRADLESKNTEEKKSDEDLVDIFNKR